MNKNKNLGFTLAEVLIVIGIIGVVAALTLPNLNHATGDKETVTRLQKAYSILNEANDRAVAIYGPISEWTLEKCGTQSLDICWMNRIREFLKVSKSCNEVVNEDSAEYSPCWSSPLRSGEMDYDGIIFQLADGMTVGTNGYDDCNHPGEFDNDNVHTCSMVYVDINGPNKGKNKKGIDIFHFGITDENGISANYWNDGGDISDETGYCMSDKSAEECTWWVFEYGNLDYLKADEDGKCNDSNIILDGVTNTSCH